MKYFLRYTENAKADLERNESYHASGLNEKDCSIEDVASMFDCDVDEIELLDNGIYSNGIENGDMCFFQVLSGLCGFELESKNLEAAIKEAENFRYNSVYNSEDMTNWSIFEGSYNDDCPEGCLFDATKIVYTR